MIYVNHCIFTYFVDKIILLRKHENVLGIHVAINKNFLSQFAKIYYKTKYVNLRIPTVFRRKLKY